jgi:hypothetical protein
MLLQEALPGEPKRAAGSLQFRHMELQRADSQILRRAAQRLRHSIANRLNRYLAKFFLAVPGVSNRTGKPDDINGQASANTDGRDHPKKPSANGPLAK